MSPRRSTRSDRILNPEPLLVVLGTCRAEVLRATITVKAFGPLYHALSMVVTAIDALATMLTGNAYHFAIGGSVPPQHGNDPNPPAKVGEPES